jgi:hypothetical protein
MRICNSRQQSWSTLITVVAVLISCVVLVIWLRQYGPENSLSRAATEQYIKSLDVSRFEDLGTSYTSDRYHPDQFPNIVGEHGTNYAYVNDLQKRLHGVNRPLVLKAIFDQVTEQADDHTQRHLAVLKFLHKVGVHQHGLKLVHEDGRKVSDPLVLLEANVMHCGQVAGVAVDLFESAGYEARTVCLEGHVVAEIWYDGDWHIFDGDSMGGNGLSPMSPDGSIPSMVELTEHPEWIDALPHRFELSQEGIARINGGYARSWRYCRSGDFEGRCYTRKPNYVNANDKYYGWTNTRSEPCDWATNETEARFQPGIVKFMDVSVVDSSDGFAEVTISWKEAKDKDNDLLGYRVFVSRDSRQWQYDIFHGSSDSQRYWNSSSGWQPEMYERIYTLPPHEVEMIVTAEPKVTLRLEEGAPYFVTVAAFDEYHERAGRVLYLMSNELRIDLEAAAAIGIEPTKGG